MKKKIENRRNASKGWKKNLDKQKKKKKAFFRTKRESWQRKEKKKRRNSDLFSVFCWLSFLVRQNNCIFFNDYLVDPASDICLFKRLSHANMRRRIYFRILWMALYKCGNESERQKAGDNDGKTVDNTRSAIRTV